MPCKVYAPTINSHLSRDADGKQGFLSPFGLFSHVSEVDRQLASPSFKVSELTSNWRQHFGLQSVASETFYYGRLAQGHVVAPAHGEQIRDFVQAQGPDGMTGARLIFDMKGSGQGEK